MVKIHLQIKKEKALDVYNYKYNKILDIYSSSKENEKYEKLDLFVKFLAEIKSDLTREIFINNVSTLFNIDKNTLNKAVNKYNTNITYKEESSKDFKNKQKVIVNSNPQKHNTHELEILRLIFNQRDAYLENKEFFDSALKDEKIINTKEFIINKNTEKFDKNDEDYVYILNYIRDDANPIVIDELMDRIKLFEKREKLKELKSLNNRTKGSFNEQRQ